MLTIDFNGDELVRTLIERLLADIRKSGNPDDKSAWTMSLKRVMKNLAADKRFGDGVRYYGHCVDDDPDDHEWLLDVIWFRADDGVLLALESEWERRTTGFVRDDFQKLLATKAPIKLMLFDSGGKEKNRSDFIADMQTCAWRFTQHLKHELYYIIDFSAGAHHVWWFQPSVDGADKTLTFTPRPDLSGPDV